MSEQSNFFSVFQNFKISFWKMASVERGKCWEKQTHEIWAHFEHPPRNHERSSTRGGSVNPLPCRIGLKKSKHGATMEITFLTDLLKAFSCYQNRLERLPWMFVFIQAIHGLKLVAIWMNAQVFQEKSQNMLIWICTLQNQNYY